MAILLQCMPVVRLYTGVGAIAEEEKNEKRKTIVAAYKLTGVCWKTPDRRMPAFLFGLGEPIWLQGLSTDSCLISAYAICAAERLQKGAMYETAKNHCRML